MKKASKPKARVCDCDLVDPQNPYSTIHVWYEIGDTEYQKDIPGFVFFHSWIAERTRGAFNGLCSYWYSIHPAERNEHMAAYIVWVLEDQPQPQSLLTRLRAILTGWIPQPTQFA